MDKIYMINTKIKIFVHIIAIAIIAAILPLGCQSQTGQLNDENLKQALTVLANSSDELEIESYLETVEELNLNNLDIRDINSLQSCSNVKVLGLDLNSIRDLKPIRNLTSLERLMLNGNQISDLRPLSNLSNLDELTLVGNNIRNIDPLASLTTLTLLGLMGNEISDISALEHLVNLQNLYLNVNQISDIGPLVRNSGLGQGDKVNLEFNPLSVISINMHIPTLEARGVIVTY